MFLFQEMAILDETVNEKKRPRMAGKWNCWENGEAALPFFEGQKRRCTVCIHCRLESRCVGVSVCQRVCVCVCLRNLVAWVCGGVCVSRCVRCVTAPRSTACEYSPRGFEIMNQ